MQFLKSRAQEHSLQCQTVSMNILWGWTFKAFKTSGHHGYLIKRPSGRQGVKTLYSHLYWHVLPCRDDPLTNRSHTDFLILLSRVKAYPLPTATQYTTVLGDFWAVYSPQYVISASRKLPPPTHMYDNEVPAHGTDCGIYSGVKMQATYITQSTPIFSRAPFTVQCSR